MDSDSLTVDLSPMKRKHLPAVIRIEDQVYSHPWNMSLFLSELALRTSRSYTVAQVGSAVVGYTGIMFVGDDAHITNIAVSPLWQRHGIASRLMMQNAYIALRNGARHITLEVRVSNNAAQSMYRKFGFAPAGIRKNYYVGLNEDALVMWANDIDTDEYASRLSAIESTISGSTMTGVAK